MESHISEPSHHNRFSDKLSDSTSEPPKAPIPTPICINNQLVIHPSETFEHRNYWISGLLESRAKGKHVSELTEREKLALRLAKTTRRCLFLEKELISQKIKESRLVADLLEQEKVVAQVCLDEADVQLGVVHGALLCPNFSDSDTEEELDDSRGIHPGHNSAYSSDSSQEGMQDIFFCIIPPEADSINHIDIRNEYRSEMSSCGETDYYSLDEDASKLSSASLPALTEEALQKLHCSYGM
ncbi:hypothetical protein BDN70DRAFT_902139 [Pholiota conissans]|uniref:Uncharacterized protein n=1 Tax=Pholiota conissans TaxID=109636 RepID=A0A9P5YIB9_9AGAR|nr:hypothetical protein BDN70DRAFT_902139 [Pholiota conissans]